jgi:hypothetical protein
MEKVVVKRAKCLASVFQGFKHSQDLVDFLTKGNDWQRSTVEEVARNAFDEKSANKVINKFVMAQIDKEIIRHQTAIKALAKTRLEHEMAIK